jgi:hypothetical protein
LLKKLEAQQRPATEAEQQMLVRYVGWGGLITGLPKRAWLRRRR